MNPFDDKGIEVQSDRYGNRFIVFHPRRNPVVLVILGGLTLVFLGVGLAGFLGGLSEFRIEYATLPFLFGGLFLLSILLWLLFNTARFTVGGGKIVLVRTCLAFQRIQTRSVGDFKSLYFQSFYEENDRPVCGLVIEWSDGKKWMFGSRLRSVKKCKEAIETIEGWILEEMQN